MNENFHPTDGMETQPFRTGGKCRSLFTVDKQEKKCSGFFFCF